MFVREMLDVARDALVTVDADRPLIEAAQRLCAGTDILIVVGSSGELRGIVTKTDIVRQMSRCDGTHCRCAISTVMTRDVAACTATDRLQDVADRMKQRHLKTIPVVDQINRPIGVLTARSILRVLLSDAEYEEAQLVDYVKGVGYR